MRIGHAGRGRAQSGEWPMGTAARSGPFEGRVGSGGGQKMSKKDALFWGVKNHESFWFFSILSRKSVFGSKLHGVCVGGVG